MHINRFHLKFLSFSFEIYIYTHTHTNLLINRGNKKYGLCVFIEIIISCKNHLIIVPNRRKKKEAKEEV